MEGWNLKAGGVRFIRAQVKGAEWPIRSLLSNDRGKYGNPGAWRGNVQ